MMLVIGLTGGIGSGKSVVSTLFEQLNVPVIDADVIAKQLTEPNTSAFTKIHGHFGNNILQGKVLNRKKLRDIIFTEPKEREWLEKLLHPLIAQEIKNQVQRLTAPYCIVSIPLLLEVAPYEFIKRVLVVDADEETQIQRVMARDHVSHDAVRAIMTTQITRDERLSRADDVIDNNLDLPHLENQVLELHKKYLEIE